MQIHAVWWMPKRFWKNLTKPKFEQVHKTKRLTYAQLKGLYDISSYIDAAIRVEQLMIERELVKAFELNMWPVVVYDGLTGNTIEYERPGFWLRLKLRWFLWRKKRKERK